MQGAELKKTWTTKAGLTAVVLFVHESHHCGYVAVEPRHPLYGKGDQWGLYTSLDVHGGVTYARHALADLYKPDDNLFWIGFDCHHLGDIPYGYEMNFWDGTFKTVEYCIGECEKLAWQLVNMKKEAK